MRVRILPYKRGSRSAAALSRALAAPRVNLVRTRFHHDRQSDVVINWGADRFPDSWYRGDHGVVIGTTINEDVAVRLAKNKLNAFRALQEARVPTVEWTEEHVQAVEWRNAGGAPVYCRRTVSGQGGAGIVVIEGAASIPNAPLYTRGFNARHEYRVHVFGQTAIDCQKKRRRDGVSVNPVRNAANGYVYCRGGVVPPAAVIEAAVNAVRALGLHFGAVDILAKENGEVAVLEVNTAPGLEGTTLQRYVDAFRVLLGRGG
jgi:glutathione synthase/RimK-type ligase-like ATP-grasp enzyme